MQSLGTVQRQLICVRHCIWALGAHVEAFPPGCLNVTEDQRQNFHAEPAQTRTEHFTLNLKTWNCGVARTRLGVSQHLALAALRCKTGQDSRCSMRDRGLLIELGTG